MKDFILIFIAMMFLLSLGVFLGSRDQTVYHIHHHMGPQHREKPKEERKEASYATTLQASYGGG